MLFDVYLRTLDNIFHEKDLNILAMWFLNCIFFSGGASFTPLNKYLLTYFIILKA